MVRVFAADISGLFDQETYDFYYQKLPAWRKAKADRIKIEEGKAHCVGAWALWQKVQEELVASAKHPAVSGRTMPGERTVQEEETVLGSEEEFLALSYVNLSHSGKYVVCAVETNHENGTLARSTCVTEYDTLARSTCVTSTCVTVGCDVEKMGPLRIKIAKRNFCPEEYEHIMAQSTEAEQTDLFYRYWVLKESFIKATREGISRPMNSFRTLWNAGEAYKVEELDAVQKKGQQFYYKEYQLDEEYKLAVCATSSTFSDEIEVIHMGNVISGMKVKK